MDLHIRVQIKVSAGVKIELLPRNVLRNLRIALATMAASLCLLRGV
jgi:hypothetical protein